MPRRLRLSQPRKYSWSKHGKHMNAVSCVVSLPLHCAPLSVLQRQIQSYGQLPHGWVMSPVSPCRNQCIQLCQLRQVDADKPPTVHYSIVIRPDRTWTSFLCGRQLPSLHHFPAMPKHVHTISNLVCVVTALQTSSECIGNPDSFFKPLAEARKGVFKNIQGTEVVAIAEATPTGNTTIRHNECDLVIPSGRRCSKCEKHRKSLLVMAHRHESGIPNVATDPQSHVNYRYLTSPQLAERCENLHNRLIASQKRISLLRSKIEILCDNSAVPVNPELEDDLHHIMKEHFTQISAQYSGNTFQRMFWEQHAQASACKNARGRRWHPAMIKWCLYLRHLSGRAYETLRNSGVIVLPSQRTLRDYTHYIPSTIGFSDKVDQMLFDTMKIGSCPSHQSYVCVVMDEMHVKEDLVYNKHSGELIGFMNLGDMNNHLISLQEAMEEGQNEKIKPLAKSLLVIMIRGLFSSLQFPYAQFACLNLTGDLMFDVFWEAVERLERMDVKVLGVTCDGSAVNRRFFKLHAHDGDTITYKTPNPFAPDKREIFFVSDPPHLIKTVRNCWASNKRVMWCNGKEILWQHLVDLYKRGTGADSATPGLSLVPKIKYEHIYLTSYSKMRVDLAAQVLSESVANALKFSRREDVQETVKFVTY